MKSILVLSDYISATQIISFLQPLAQSISKGDMRLRLEAHSKKPKVLEGIIDSEKPSFFIMSRYTWEKGKSAARFAQKKGIPVIYHLDDDLLNVPKSLGETKFAVYNDPRLLANLRANMEAADLLYASTPALAKTLAGYNLDVPIVGGDLYCSVSPEQVLEPTPSTMPTIGYMGTGGHSEDLTLVLPAVEALMDELPLLRFETFGSIPPPPSFARFGDRYMHHQPVFNYIEFRQRLNSLGWWIGLAPLQDTPFNRCKADTKWVEYSAAGAVTVASDLPVYHNACSDGAGILAGSTGDWGSALRRLIYDPHARQGYVANAQNKLQHIYRRENLASQLMRVFEATQSSAKHRKLNAGVVRAKAN